LVGRNYVAQGPIATKKILRAEHFINPALPIVERLLGQSCGCDKFLFRGFRTFCEIALRAGEALVNR
jgi:hypothetical protein